MTDQPNHVRPYANLPGGPVIPDAPLGELVDEIATGLEVAAIVVPVPEVGPTAGLLLSFTLPDGSAGPHVALVCAGEELLALCQVYSDAVNAALEAAEASR